MPIAPHRLALAALAAAMSLAGLGASRAQAPPPAPVRPVQDVYHGQTVTDPYRWMEARDAGFTDWARAQDAAARAALDATPDRAAIREAIAKFSAANTAAGSAELAGGRVFYLKRPPGGAQAALYVRALPGGPDRLLFDPAALSRSESPVALGAFAPSPDGRYVAYTLSEGGSEESVLHVLETATGKALSETIDRTRFAVPAWDPVRPEFYYARTKSLKEGEPPAERFRDQAVYRHRIGDDPDRDQLVFAVSEQKGEYGREGIPVLKIPHGSAWAFAYVNSGVSTTGEFYVAEVAALRAGKPAWRRILSTADQVLQYSAASEAALSPAVRGGFAWFGSTKDAPRGKVVRVDLVHGGPPVTVVPEGDGVLTLFTPAGDGAYLGYAAGGRHQIRHLDLGTGHTREIATPFAGSIYEIAADDSRPGAVFSLESWARPRRLYGIGATGGVHDLGLSPPFPFDLGQVVTEEIVITARDGTPVPVSIMRRADNRRDGKASGIVETYGAYGISADPYFDARWMPWVLRGGVYVTVHARGGGEFGESWWKAGFQATKPNTWRDLIDATEAVKRLGYVAPDKVVGLGTSAGGVAIGRALTERPDLFAGAIGNVPISDLLRFETTEGGPGNVAEFGSVATPDGFRNLQAMSPYENVAAGTAYPAVLLTAGANDHRVPAWQPAKLAARLQAATASGRPVLLRVDWAAGHGIGSSRTQRDELYADFYAFALLATGGR